MTCDKEVTPSGTSTVLLQVSGFSAVEDELPSLARGPGDHCESFQLRIQPKGCAAEKGALGFRVSCLGFRV